MSALLRLLAALLLLPGLAAAHTNPLPRWDRVEITPSQVQIEVGWDLDPGAASREVRERFDRDRSGWLEPAERAALCEWMAAAAALHLRVWVGGEALTLERREVKVSPLDVPATSGRALGLRLTVASPLPAGGGRTLIIEDAHPARTHPIALDLTDRSGWPPTLAQQEIRGPAPARARVAGQWNPAQRTLTGVILEPGEQLVVGWTTP